MYTTVEIKAGTVRGWTDGAVASFLGIPYGEPPTACEPLQAAHTGQALARGEGRPGIAKAPICICDFTADL